VLLGTLPGAVVVFGLFIAFCFFVLQPVVSAGAAALGLGKISIKFLGVGVAYYAWLLVLPVLGGIRALRSPPGDRVLAGLWLAASGAVLLDSLWIEPGRLQVEEVRIRLHDLPAGERPLRVAVVSDLQSPLLTDRVRRVAEVMRELEPDLILMPGDLVAQSLEEALTIEAARFVTSRAEAPLGAHYVKGDVEDFAVRDVEDLLRDTPVQRLDNGGVLLEWGGTTVELVGFDPAEEAAYARARNEPPRADLRIALIHRPRHGEELAARGFDLVVAGHTHGGQVTVPGFGPLITCSPLPRSIARGGLHPLGHGGQLYVSRGIGLESGFAPPIRFFCPPEVSLLVLEPAGDALAPPSG
jgi:predicted MPP superfamily phosphohydrolase